MNDPISKINLWCQKESKSPPAYNFAGFGTIWVCIINAEWLEEKVSSENCTSKKLAKYDAAERALQKIIFSEKVFLDINESTIFLIDGDQRVDCWRWLASTDTNWKPDLLDIIVFTSPTAYQIELESESNKNIEIVKAKTTNKDSADALILMTLGKLLVSKIYKKYVIISSDHILVQAADDNKEEGVEWINNLKILKEKYIKNE